MLVSPWRYTVVGGFLVLLAGALVWVLMGGGEAEPAATTRVETTAATSPPSTALAAPTTVPATTVASTTSSTTEAERVAEVEVILRDLWFGWFDAIYRNDPDALWEVVATTPGHDAGVAAMETLEFTAEPSLQEMHVDVKRLLLDRPDCLAVHVTADAAAFRGPGAMTERVEVLWPDPRYGWRFATSWKHPDDMWLTDCDNMVREETP